MSAIRVFRNWLLRRGRILVAWGTRVSIVYSVSPNGINTYSCPQLGGRPGGRGRHGKILRAPSLPAIPRRNGSAISSIPIPNRDRLLYSLEFSHARLWYAPSYIRTRDTRKLGLVQNQSRNNERSTGIAADQGRVVTLIL